MFLFCLADCSPPWWRPESQSSDLPVSSSPTSALLALTELQTHFAPLFPKVPATLYHQSAVEGGPAGMAFPCSLPAPSSVPF